MKKIYIALALITLLSIIACSGDESNKKEITSYSLAGIVGTINEEEKTIAVEVPYNADVTALIATFTTTGSRVNVGAAEQISGTTVNNFTSPLIYTVTAEDSSKTNYTVTVTLAPSPEKAITAFSLAGVVGRINEEEKTIVVGMPSGTDFTALIATFTTTGSSVNVGATAQISGTTANDFTSPLRYTVTAEDGSSANYTVTVGIAITAWQTCCGSEPGRVHDWRGTTGELTIERLPLVSPTFRSGYLYTQDGDLLAQDRVSWEVFRFNAITGSFVPDVKNRRRCAQFTTATHLFVYQEDQVSACPLDGGECKIIAMHKGTFTLAYAENKGRVLATNNWGEVFIFNGTDWCRCSQSGDTYRCDPNQPMLESTTGIQFYSSIKYRGKTLVGDFPSGRLYEFDGESLHPADMLQPPLVTTGERIEGSGYEAQSIAEYCGDLFVGYYPRGEIWRFHRSTGEWSMAARLFSHPVEAEPFVPYFDRREEGLASSFYGQRVQTLIPFGDSLYAVTSNLGLWPVGYESKIMTKDEAAEYGAVYRLTIPGCHTIEP